MCENLNENATLICKGFDEACIYYTAEHFDEQNDILRVPFPSKFGSVLLFDIIVPEATTDVTVSVMNIVSSLPDDKEIIEQFHKAFDELDDRYRCVKFFYNSIVGGVQAQYEFPACTPKSLLPEMAREVYMRFRRVVGEDAYPMFMKIMSTYWAAEKEAEAEARVTMRDLDFLVALSEHLKGHAPTMPDTIDGEVL